jgi:hypothetical protein
MFRVNCRITAMRKKELTVLQNASKTPPTLKIKVEGEVFHSLNKKNRTKLYRRLLSSLQMEADLSLKCSYVTNTLHRVTLQRQESSYLVPCESQNLNKAIQTSWVQYIQIY